MKRIALIALLASIAMLFQSTAFAVGPEHTGSWYNSDQNGHGFSIEYGDAGNGTTPLMVVYWYVYDKDGSPVFLTGTGYPDANGVDITFYAHYGMKYGTFNPGDHQERDGGVARFTFQNEKNGTFEYFPSVWTKENFGHSQHQMPITKLFAVTHPYVDPPPTGEPIPNPGSWSGRMTYNRNSTGGNACYDADVQVVVIITGKNDSHFVSSITVSPDAGGLYISQLTAFVSDTGHASGNIYDVNGQSIDFTIAFSTQGTAQGAWTYVNSDCYGEWTFTKD